MAEQLIEGLILGRMDVRWATNGLGGLSPLSFAAYKTGGEHMRLFLSVDMEGTTGLERLEEIFRGLPGYDTFRQ